MKNEKVAIGHLIERVDIVGWLSVTIAIIWLLFDVFNIAPPWLAENLPQATLLVLGFLAIYLHRAFSEVRSHLAQQNKVNLILGNERVYEAAIELIQQSPRQARFWATSFWFYPRIAGETPASQRYFEALKARLQDDPEAEYRRACSTITRSGWEIIKKRTIDLLMTNARHRYYYSNPLVLDCLIGEAEAILAFPDRRAFPHIRAAIYIRDAKMVDALRQWYQDFIWDSAMAKSEINEADELAKIEERLSREWMQLEDSAG